MIKLMLPSYALAKFLWTIATDEQGVFNRARIFGQDMAKITS